MGALWHHCAVLSLCPNPEENRYQADNFLYIGESQANVWAQTKEWIDDQHEQDPDCGWSSSDIWVLSWDIWLDWEFEDTPPTDPVTGEINEDEFWYPIWDRLDMLNETVMYDNTWFGNSQDPFDDDDAIHNALWMTEQLLMEPHLSYGLDLKNAKIEPYALWRARLYPSQFRRAG